MMAADKIRPAAVKIGIRPEPSQRLGFHNFRHSLATFLINKGKDVKTIHPSLVAQCRHILQGFSRALSFPFSDVMAGATRPHAGVARHCTDDHLSPYGVSMLFTDQLFTRRSTICRPLGMLFTRLHARTCLAQ